VCRSGDAQPWRDGSLPVHERVELLLSRMTPEEKAAQLGGVMWNPDAGDEQFERMREGIGQVSTLLFNKLDHPSSLARLVTHIQTYLLKETRLGIPALFHGEALSGPMLPGGASFPLAIGLAAAWDPDGLEEMARVAKEQLRAVGIRHALSPVLDVGRDPRWGRIGETYGEDPTLVARLGVSFVAGLQGEDWTEGVAATAKHFLGYSVTEGALNMAESAIPPRTLREVYARPFEAAVRKAGIAAVMNSYSSLDGDPVIASPSILRDLLRGELGFRGVTVSDYRSIDRLVSAFRTAADMKQAGLQALRAGMDMELPRLNAYAHLPEALRNGEIDAELVDAAVRRVLELKFRLGLFERPYPETERIEAVFRRDRHEALALRMARESMVLVKNEGGLLPLDGVRIRRLAVIGPNADNLRNLFGGYSHPAVKELFFGMSQMAGVDLDKENRRPYEQQLHELETEYLPRMYPGMTTVYRELSARLPHAEVTYAPGCGWIGTDRSGFAEAVRLAAEADIVVMAVGGKDGFGKPCTTGEGNDSSQIGLPGVQEELVQAVHAAGKPIVLVHMSARPLSSPWIAEHIPAVLEAWHPGAAGAKAIADVLLGVCNPGGKLPVTAAPHSGQLPLYCAHRRGSGHEGRSVDTFVSKEGYVNETLGPLYPFGHGLSYTTFAYSDLELSDVRIGTAGAVEISCAVENTGTIAGDEVVQLYVADETASLARPVKELAGFARVHLRPGEKKRICFRLHASQTAFLDRKMEWIVEPGMFRVMIGSSSRDIRLEGAFEIVGETTRVAGGREYYAEVRITGA